jgi:calcium/calmodulin-dependent protein kinase I
MSTPKFYQNDPNEPIEKYFKITNTQLGSGYFAKVRLGVDKTTGQEVAIKMINKKLVESPGSLENEISIMKKVSHPNIVQMIAVFDTPEILYIVMELMQGGELYERIVKQKKFTEEDAAKITRQIFDALAYLHDIGIVHRDLKLENLLLVTKEEGDNRIKLADFGLSKLYSGKSLQTACGTPFYVAPDVLLGGGYGPAVDCWSTGVLLYVLLSGRLPFSADNDADLFRLIMKADLVFKSPQFDTVSAAAKDLIRRLLVADSKKRLTAKEALDHPYLKDKVEPTPLHNTLFEGLRSVSQLTKKMEDTKLDDDKDHKHKEGDHHKKDDHHKDKEHKDHKEHKEHKEGDHHKDKKDKKEKVAKEKSKDKKDKKEKEKK